jgi:hypothetical protein
VKYAIVLLACALPLFTIGACSSEPEINARNASAEEVATQVADSGGSGQFVRPGKWQSRVQIEQFDLPGAPPGVANSLRGVQDRSTVQESCLTPEQAKRPKEDFFAGKGKNCRYDRFTMANGKIDAVMQCSGDGMAQTMTMQGSYSPETYQMRMSMKADAGAGPAGGMTMTMRVDSKRIGECDGKTA